MPFVAKVVGVAPGGRLSCVRQNFDARGVLVDSAAQPGPVEVVNLTRRGYVAIGQMVVVHQVAYQPTAEELAAWGAARIKGPGPTHVCEL